MKTNKLALSCALAAATALSAFAEECVVLRPGEVEVVLPAKPLPIERFAADELTNFLSRVIGAPVPVIGARSNGTDSVAILLGRAAGFDVSAFERDAFRTKVERSSDGAAGSTGLPATTGSGCSTLRTRRFVSSRINPELRSFWQSTHARKSCLTSCVACAEK